MKIRPIQPDELACVNEIIESCVMRWNIPERVKRLSLGMYRYNAVDLEHFEIMVAVTLAGELSGVAALESQAPCTLPGGKRGLLLHGLYVATHYQNQLVGSRLVATSLEAARENALDGLLVKAHSGATGYFMSRGFIKLPDESSGRNYPHLWWKSV